MYSLLVYFILLFNSNFAKANLTELTYTNEIYELKQATAETLKTIVSRTKNIKTPLEFLSLEEISLYSEILSALTVVPIRMVDGENFLKLFKTFDLEGRDASWDKLSVQQFCKTESLNSSSSTMAFVIREVRNEGVFLCPDGMKNGEPLISKVQTLIHEMAHVIGITDESKAEKLAIVGLMISGSFTHQLSSYYVDDEGLRLDIANAYRYFFIPNPNTIRVGDKFKMKITFPLRNLGNPVYEDKMIYYNLVYSREELEAPVKDCGIHEVPPSEDGGITLNEIRILESQFVNVTIERVESRFDEYSVLFLLADNFNNYNYLYCRFYFGPDYQMLNKIGILKNRT